MPREDRDERLWTALEIEVELFWLFGSEGIVFSGFELGLRIQIVQRPACLVVPTKLLSLELCE